MATNGTTSPIRSIVDASLPKLETYEDIYRDIHRNPELGELEKRTSELAAAHLQQAGYDVTSNIGGYGVVGVLSNGDGPTVLLRADMDALPVREQTGLEYASTVEAVDTDGDKKPVMHACGHDTHVTALMGAATLLAEAKPRWRGTLLVLFQPDEEHGRGARAMLDDGVYDKIQRKPDIVLGQHLGPYKTGVVLVRPGVLMAAADTLKVTIVGQGAHGARPQDSIDPIVLACSIVVRLQTIVSREIGPDDVASVTCASIHGGKAHNVIPNEAEFLLNIRTFDPAVREKVISAINRIVKGECIASGTLEEPKIEQVLSYPLTVNDDEATKKIEDAFLSFFEKDRTWEAPRGTVSEDFSNLATAINVPSVFWYFGGVDAKLWERYEKEKDEKLIPKFHQANNAPVIEPTLRTGIEALSVAALTFLNTNVDS